MTPAQSIALIQRTVAGHYGLTVEQMLKPKHTAAIVWPRSEAIYIASLVVPRFLWGHIFAAFRRENSQDFVKLCIARVKTRITGAEIPLERGPAGSCGQ